MFHKDTFRLIRKTANRFFSLLMIVLIGVAFMMGLLSTRIIMEDSVDSYVDEYRLQDIQLYSSYGFCDEDIEAIKKHSYVDRVFASRFADVYSESADGTVRVTRVEEVERDLNRVELVSGRMPQSADEAVILDGGMTKGEFSDIGELRLFLDDSDISEVLKNDTFKIVGIVKTPTYMAKTLGSGILKNQDISAVIYIPSENFLSDYYTTVYLTLTDAAELESFSKEYTEYIAEAKEELQNFTSKQQHYIKDTLLAEYKEEIEKGEQELEEKRTEGQQQLDEAKQQLDDASAQIASGEAQIASLEQTLYTAISTYNNIINTRKIDPQQVYDRIAEVEADDANGRSFAIIAAEITADRGTYLALKSMIDSPLNTLFKDQMQARINELSAKYGGDIEGRYTEISKLVQDKIYADIVSSEMDIAKQAEQRAREEINSLKAQVYAGKAQYEQGLKEYEEGLETFNTEIEKAEIEIRKAYQQLDELPAAEWMILDRDSHYSTYLFKGNAKQMGSIGISLPLLFYLVAALVCLTTMTRLVDEQRGQIGVFRALGFSNGKIVSKYVIYALTATIIGSVIGIFIGMAIFPTVIYRTWRLLYDLPAQAVIFPIKNVVICLLAFSVLMTAVTVYVVRRTLKEMPSQLMRPKPPKNAKRVFLEKIPPVWRQLSFTGKITARNLIRYKARAIMTIIGVAGCTGLLVMGWGVKDSIRDIVAIQFGQLYNYDYTVNMENDKLIEDTIEILEKDDTNEAVAPYMIYTSKVYLKEKEPTINVVVLDARQGNDMLKFRETDRRTPVKIKNSGVIVNEKFAKNNGIHEGDIITIESASGLKAQVKVVKIYELYFQHYLYMSDEYYEEVFGENVHYNSIVIRNSEKTADEISEEISSSEGYESITDFTGLISQFDKMIEALDFIILVVLVTAGSLAFVVLLNLTQVNISERIREIATLKVLGFHNSEVNSYIFKEIFLLSVIGAVLGLPLGVVEHHFIMNVITMDMIMFGKDVKPMSFVTAFVITIVFTLIVLLITRRPLKKVEMVESLKSVE